MKTTSEPVDRSVGRCRRGRGGTVDARGRRNIIRMSCKKYRDPIVETGCAGDQVRKRGICSDGVEEAMATRAVVGGEGDGGDKLKRGRARMTAEGGEGVRVIL